MTENKHKIKDSHAYYNEEKDMMLARRKFQKSDRKASLQIENSKIYQESEKLISKKYSDNELKRSIRFRLLLPNQQTK